VAPKKKSPSRVSTANPLVGKYFHSIEADGKTIKWQGLVKAHVGGPADLYLLQTFEWIMGGDSTQELVPSEKMAGWRFYDSSEEMKEYYEHYRQNQEASA
jgi:hypothetical protein